MNKDLIAAHEIGHFIVAKKFNLRVELINITNLKIPFIKINYGRMESLAKQIHLRNSDITILANNNEDRLEFIINYLHVLISGYVCEELYRLSFNSRKLSISWANSDFDIVKHYLLDNEIQDAVSHVSGICISSSTQICSFVDLLLKNNGLLNEKQLYHSRP